MTHGSGRQGPQQARALEAQKTNDARTADETVTRAKKVDIRESGIVPARSRGLYSPLPRAVALRASRAGVSGFGSVLACSGNALLVGGRLEGTQPFAALYRVTSVGVVRERVLRGTPLHLGPSIASDGVRVAVGQPGSEGGSGFVNVYRRSDGELELETTLELRPDDPATAGFGQVVAIDGELLVAGQPASVSVYRHSAVGWLSAGTPRPQLPYQWNPRFGLSCAVSAGRVLVGNPVEIDGHRAGPGRVFVYRQKGDHVELEAELTGDGIEAGRGDEPRAGFGAEITVAGEFVLISAPYELSSSGSERSRVYVYRVVSGALQRVADIDVPSVRSVCMVGEKLFVLGDSLYVYGRQGNRFEALAVYPVNGASAQQVTMAACGQMLVLGYPFGYDEGDAGEVALHFAEQL